MTLPRCTLFTFTYIRLFLLSLFSIVLTIGKSMAQDTFYVNTVVHIIQADPTSITDLQIETAIQNMNDGFANRGLYAGGKGSDSRVRFRLARVAPDGGVTKGITRTKSIFQSVDVKLEDGKLKQQIGWDANRYFNVWVVSSINGENMTMFNCGSWQRVGYGGYASGPPGGSSGDGAVVASLGTVLIHEAGHYLGLKHTFDGGCQNNDCSVDGDGICDTPPQSVIFSNCSAVVNSCITDTLSGFSTGQPDLNDNFMGYGGCPTAFTAGQGAKMREVLQTARIGLTDTISQIPCSQTLTANFDRNEWFPVIGSAITFTATPAPGVDYQWFINGSPAGSSTTSFSYTFLAKGVYEVSLRVSEGASCFASYTHNVIVNCGVVSRFFPNKQKIASKIPEYPDNILFTNKSFRATDYKWLMSNDTGMVEQVISTETDLNYVFRNYGNYTVRLVATTGSCVDTSDRFMVTVEDPMREPYIGRLVAECYDETKMRVQVTVCNSGYETMPKDVPVTFYNRDPRLPGAVKLGSTVNYPYDVPGRCCGSTLIFLLDVGVRQLDTLFAAFNDDGKSLPLVYPNTSFYERYFFNNVTRFTGIRYRVKVTPASVVTYPGDTILIRSAASPASSNTYQWQSTMPNLICTTCKDVSYEAGKKDATLMVAAKSQNGCFDTAVANVKVVPGDDFQVKIKRVDCYKEDSILLALEVCNLYLKKRLLKDLAIKIYNGSPYRNGFRIGTVIVPATVNAACSTMSVIVPKKVGDSLFVVVNDTSTATFTPPSADGLLELRYDNNMDSVLFVSEQPLSISPADTIVFYGDKLIYSIKGNIPSTSVINWTADSRALVSCTNCPTPEVTFRGRDTLRVTVTSMYGCNRFSAASMKVFPPDLTLSLIEAECIQDTATRVLFRICMNNGFDTLAHDIPVSFYGKNPASGSASRLVPVFFTGPSRNTGCDTFSIILPVKIGTVYALVNDAGNGVGPGKGIVETNYTNNNASIETDRFKVELLPSDTLVFRDTRVRLRLNEYNDKAVTYRWTSSSLISCPDCPQPIVYVPHTMTVSLVATNRFGCLSGDTIKIRCIYQDTLQLPNAFTPNNDGLNDIFYVIASQDVEKVTDFSIFNRFGETIFRKRNIEPNDPVHGWNGYLTNGMRAPTGVYIYQVQIVLRDGTTKWYKGTIAVVR